MHVDFSLPLLLLFVQKLEKKGVQYLWLMLGTGSY